jgi:hypothetical protein
VFIVEALTTSGKVCEKFATYEEARRRVERIRPDALVGVPLIFRELPDGSTRLVRDDLKPLQWHRTLAEEEDKPIPLSDLPADASSDQPLIKVLPPEPRDPRWDE